MSGSVVGRYQGAVYQSKPESDSDAPNSDFRFLQHFGHFTFPALEPCSKFVPHPNFHPHFVDHRKGASLSVRTNTMYERPRSNSTTRSVRTSAGRSAGRSAITSASDKNSPSAAPSCGSLTLATPFNCSWMLRVSCLADAFASSASFASFASLAS